MENTSLSQRPFAAVIMAAGLGTRMKSDLPKVMHQVAGRPIVAHAVAACEALGAEKIVVVVSPATRPFIEPVVAPHKCAIQEVPRGTGDAVKAAREALKGYGNDIVVLNGDAPMVTAEALKPLLDARAKTGAAVVVGGFRTPEPGAYGRMVLGEGVELLAIVEAKEATPEQLRIDFCNSSVYAFEAGPLWGLLDQIRDDNAKKEYYLTDVVHLARQAGLKTVAVEMPFECAMGVNTRVELAEAEEVMQERMRRAWMLAGVTMQAPQTVYLSYDTKFGQDVVIEPNVVFGTGVEVASKATIRAFTRLEKTKVEA